MQDSSGYQDTPPHARLASDLAELDGRIAVRRHTDRCFHLAEEVTPEGYIVQGVLIPADEIAEWRENPDAACDAD